MPWIKYVEPKIIQSVDFLPFETSPELFDRTTAALETLGTEMVLVGSTDPKMIPSNIRSADVQCSPDRKVECQETVKD